VKVLQIATVIHQSLLFKEVMGTSVDDAIGLVSSVATVLNIYC